MSKRPTPKKHRARSATRTQYSAYVRKQTQKLKNKVHLIPCPKCETPVPLHTMCGNCGTYRGKELQKSPAGKITKIAA